MADGDAAPRPHLRRIRPRVRALAGALLLAAVGTIVLPGQAAAQARCHDEVRLVGGDSESEGDVEYCRNNEWRYVCDDNWDKKDADVACRQAGYPRGAYRARAGSYYVSLVNVELWLSELACNGNESSLAECDRPGDWGEHHCSPEHEKAGAVCRADAFPTGAPTITGSAQVGRTLLALTGGISDADGTRKAENGVVEFIRDPRSPDSGRNVDHSFTYQWVQVRGRSERDIPGATRRGYTLTQAEAHIKVKVRVRFVDDDGNREEVTSEAWPAGRNYIGRVSAEDRPQPPQRAAPGYDIREIKRAGGSPGNDDRVTRPHPDPSGSLEVSIEGRSGGRINGRPFALIFDDYTSDRRDDKVVLPGSASDRRIHWEVSGPAAAMVTVGSEDRNGCAYFRRKSGTFAVNTDPGVSGTVTARKGDAGGDILHSDTFRVRVRDSVWSSTSPQDLADRCSDVWLKAEAFPGPEPDPLKPEDVDLPAAKIRVLDRYWNAQQNVTVHEGNVVRLRLELSKAVSFPVTVRYAILGGGGHGRGHRPNPADDFEGLDGYAGENRKVTFPAWQRLSDPLEFRARNDGVWEPEETFTFMLTDPNSSDFYRLPGDGGDAEAEVTIAKSRNPAPPHKALRVSIHQTDESTVVQGDPVKFLLQVHDPDPHDAVSLAAVGGSVPMRLVVVCEKLDRDHNFFNQNRAAECRDLTLEGTRGRDTDGGLSKEIAVSGSRTISVGTEPDTIHRDRTQENFSIRLRYDGDHDGVVAPLGVSGNWFTLGSIRKAGHLGDPCDHVAEDIVTGCAVAATAATAAAQEEEQEQEAGPLTAKFLDVPVSHDGAGAFTLRLEFSADVEISPEDLRDHALSANGGAVTGVSRVGGAKDLFEVTVTPAGDGAVSVQLLPAFGGCEAEGAVCTASGTALSSLLLTRVRGPGPGLTVADAEATEGEDATLDFVVTLSPAADGTVTVAYETSDGTATAPADYTAASGTLTFDPGETSKTVPVAIVDDGVEDSGETMKLTLSGATGAAIDDREAIGTILNTEPLTASFSDLPEAHDGSTAFTFELTFSEDVEGLSYATLRDGGIEATGGTVTKARRHGSGTNRHWTIHVAPDGDGPVTVVLPETADCADDGAVCAPDGRMLSNESRATVQGPPAVPLTASFSDLPEAHDGSSAFTFTLTFSEDVEGLSYATLRDGAFDVAGGRVVKAPRKVRGSNESWTIHVEPDGNGPVTVALPETTDCADDGAVCTPDGRMLSNGSRATVPGPPGLSVADAAANEADTDASLDFAVTLDRAASGTVTVAYETSDGTAAAPGDYAETSGTLTFSAGEVAKTVSVPVHADHHDEGSETMTLTLSAPTGGAYLKDAEATGTIANSGPVPQAWLSRFGRTVAEQGVDAVRSRLSADRTPGFRGSIAGEALPDGTGTDGAGTETADAAGGETGEGPLAIPEFTESERLAFLALLAPATGGDGDDDGADSRSGTAEEAMLGTAFEIARETDGGLSLGLWGRVARSGFSGRQGDLDLDGDVTSAMLGTDWKRRDALLGLMLFRSRGEGGYAGPAGEGRIEADLTGLVPWAGRRKDGTATLWGAAGTGRGGMTLAPEGQDPVEAGLGWSMAAAGAEGAPVTVAALGEADLRWRADALATRTTSDAVEGLAASSAETVRLSLGLEAAWERTLASGATLSPRLEFGLRHDGGDAETGFGIEAGGGVRYRDPGRGLSVSVDGRALALHEDGDLRDWGMGVSLEWDPRPETRLGPSVIATRGWGGAPSGGVAALLDPEALPGDDGGAGGGSGSLGLEMAWGTDLSAWRHGAVGSAYGRVSGSPDAEELRLGWRVAPDEGHDVGLDHDFWLESRHGRGGRDRGRPELDEGEDGRAVLPGHRPRRGRGRRRGRVPPDAGMVGKEGRAPRAHVSGTVAPSADGSAQDAGGAHAGERRHGRWWIARPDGWAEEGCYVHGLMHGEWVLRDPEGRIVARERWCLGRSAGPGPADGGDAACAVALPDACRQESTP